MTRAILLMSLLVASCATTMPGPVRVLPPIELLQDCPIPASPLDTNGALAQWAQELRAALLGCNLDKRALREWANQ